MAKSKLIFLEEHELGEIWFNFEKLTKYSGQITLSCPHEANFEIMFKCHVSDSGHPRIMAEDIKLAREAFLLILKENFKGDY